jgi:hypothetical protein
MLTEVPKERVAIPIEQFKPLLVTNPDVCSEAFRVTTWG